ncbi:MAG: hypothetical protein Ct9H90mP3_7540 [Flammeovirgaceae bacterium]|nr:MAG: hypothetical protein Ct9H90mP3_7540 [Flammeovirgaceae bacterium]
MINDKKLEISTDIDLFKKQTSSKIISVTGTNGKTTGSLNDRACFKKIKNFMYSMW